MIVEGIEYGPLGQLIGRWAGESGMDVSPEPDGSEHTPYYETIVYEACGDVSNAEKQTLAILRYHQVVSMQSSGEVFHNESGYLTWDSETGTVTQSFVIPRGVAVVAGGEATEESDEVNISVKATRGDADYGILEAPFMRDNASTRSFTHDITVKGDSLQYEEMTIVDIYNRTFEHSDGNTLTRVN